MRGVACSRSRGVAAASCRNGEVEDPVRAQITRTVGAYTPPVQPSTHVARAQAWHNYDKLSKVAIKDNRARELDAREARAREEVHQVAADLAVELVHVGGPDAVVDVDELVSVVGVNR